MLILTGLADQHKAARSESDICVSSLLNTNAHAEMLLMWQHLQ